MESLKKKAKENWKAIDHSIKPQLRDKRPLPSEYAGFEREWNELNPEKLNPRTLLTDPNAGGEVRKRVKALALSYDSHERNRSPYRTTIMLFGDSGAGKSSTVNNLLGGESVAEVSSKASMTRDTREYVLKKDDDDISTTDLSLGIIDTPGLGDGLGMIQDACNLASIDKMIQNYVPFKSIFGTPSVRYFPNIILLVIKAGENRFEDKCSNFSKILNVIEKFKIVDQRRNNLVLVLSHAMSYGDINNKKQWKREMKRKACRLQEIVEEFLGVYPKAVWIENNFKRKSEEESEESCNEEDEVDTSSEVPDTRYGLEVSDEWTLLPDGTKQFLNLYDAIASTMKANGDNLGLQTVNHFFKEPNNERFVRKEEGAIQKAKIIDPKKETKLNDKEKAMLKVIKSQAGLNTEETTSSPISKTIRDWIKREKKDGTLTSEGEKEAMKLIKILTLRLNMNAKDPLRHFHIGEIQQMLGKSEKLTELQCELLKDLFHVKEARLAVRADSCLGRGYDIFIDDTKPASIFEFSFNNCKGNCNGLEIPDGVKLQIWRDTLSFMDYFESEQEYISKRLKDLGVACHLSKNLLLQDLFKMKFRCGFNRFKSSQSKNSQQELSFSYERRLFRMTLPDLTNRHILKFSGGFEDALKNLPENFNSSNEISLKEFQWFFNNWGQFVVVEVFAGGSLNIQNIAFQRRGSETTDNLLETKAEINAFLHASKNMDVNFEKILSESSRKSFEKSSLAWSGGDTKLQCHSMGQMSPKSWQDWSDSLHHMPSILTTDLSLIPIYELAEGAKKNALRDAFDFMFNQDKQCLSTGARPLSFNEQSDGENERTEVPDRRTAVNKKNPKANCSIS